MPKLRAKTSGRYKYSSINGVVEKELYLKDYYRKHKTAIDRAINKYKKDKNINISNEKLFVDTLKYGRDWGSVKQAKAAIERKIVDFRGEDTNWYDAKHGSKREIFGDLRKLNRRKPNYIDYSYQEANGYWHTDGYYETSNPDIVIVNKVVTPSEDSPYSYWEYMYKNKIGL